MSLKSLADELLRKGYVVNSCNECLLYALSPTKHCVHAQIGYFGDIELHTLHNNRGSLAKYPAKVLLEGVHYSTFNVKAPKLSIKSMGKRLNLTEALDLINGLGITTNEVNRLLPPQR